MSEHDQAVRAPTADEIERRFRNPAVHIARPVIWAIIEVLCVVRRFRWEAVGLERLRSAEEPFILVANHSSHADTAAILAALPKAVRKRTAVAAALDVFGPAGGGPRRSWKRACLQFIVAAGFRAFAFDRHGPPLRSIRTSAQLIKGGWNLLLYPEGTRSREGQLQPFKAGAGVLAKFTGRAVVPVHVEGGTRVLPCDATMPRPGRMIVRFGQPVRYIEGESLTEFTAQLESTVRELGAATHQKLALEAAAPRPRLVARLRRLAFGN
jgi:1-acyl-sn-glycerol-3-phosphate acyltransferase